MNEDMADAARGTQARCAGGHRAHQLVRMQAALHEEFALPLVDQPDSLGRGGLAMRGIYQLIARDIDPMLPGDCSDLLGRSHQNGRDDTEFRRLARAAQRSLVARMDNHRAGRRHLFRERDELVVLVGGRMFKRASGCNGTDLSVLKNAQFSAVAGFLVGSFVRMISPGLTSGFAETEWRRLPVRSQRVGQSRSTCSRPQSRAPRKRPSLP
jgi:hypothetical protein